MAVLGMVATLLWPTPLSAQPLAVAQTASHGGAPPHRCEPSINQISGLWEPGSSRPLATIHGTCFGDHKPFFEKDNMYIRVTDLGPHGTVAQLNDPADGPSVWWSACSARHDAVNGDLPDAVTCTVTNWTNTSITLVSFDFSTLENAAADHTPPSTTVPPNGIRTGLLDTYAVQVWNPENGTGPAVALAYLRLPPA